MIYNTALGNILSRISGFFADLYLPPFCRSLILGSFAKTFGINIAEAEKTISAYTSLNNFFTRSLKPECRPISQNIQDIVSPVDAYIQAFGRIEDNQLIQAKGVTYSIEDLIAQKTIAFQEGYFITFYLAPHDCHRIFSPFSGQIESISHIPGHLYPVREPHISHTTGLYTLNERIITQLKTDYGRIAIVKVGAFNVGTISVPFDPAIRSNVKGRKWTS
jgi:phosphatidylserine decarboxylase